MKKKKKQKRSLEFSYNNDRGTPDSGKQNGPCPDLRLIYHKGSLSSQQRSEHVSMIPPGINPTNVQLTIGVYGF